MFRRFSRNRIPKGRSVFDEHDNAAPEPPPEDTTEDEEEEDDKEDKDEKPGELPGCDS